MAGRRLLLLNYRQILLQVLLILLPLLTERMRRGLSGLLTNLMKAGKWCLICVAVIWILFRQVAIISLYKVNKGNAGDTVFVKRMRAAAEDEFDYTIFWKSNYQELMPAQ